MPTGIGPAAAARAADESLARASLATALIVGLSGALDPAYALGDLLLLESVAAPGFPPRGLDANLVAALRRRLPAARTGVRGFSSERFVAKAAVKRRLRAASGADALDMETYALVERLQGAGVRCAALRCVSDTAAGDVPDLTQAFRADGTLDRWRVGRALLREPAAAWRLVRGGATALVQLRGAMAALRSASP